MDSLRMTDYQRKLRSPWVAGIGGILISMLLWAFLWYDTYADLKLIDTIQQYIAWIVLIFGLGFTFLIVQILRAAELSKIRSIELDKINASMKKEIIERVHAEESKQKLEIAMVQGQKLQAIGTLAGGIAHDFNNILYAIIGYTQMAREDVGKDSQLYQNLGKVLEASQRGQELVSRILSFSRRQHHEVSELYLIKSIESVLSLLRPTVPASVVIDFNPGPEIKILGNQTQLHQVMVNIINNAVDAMDGEGTIRIDISRLAANDPYLRSFPDIETGDYCKIEITDTGHGMDQHTVDRIFEPFYTTKEVGKGTGLGLSIVHSIIKEHKGDVTVTSQLGHGTKFVILLPVYEEKGA